MPFDIRCPECEAKLRLDEAPEPGTSIECPRCGSQFRAPKKGAGAPTARPKAEKTRKDKPAGERKAKKKRKIKKKRTNPILLLIAIGFGFVGLAVVGFLMVWMLNRAGRVEEMLTYVPNTCNWARGVNVAQLSKYPGYANELTKFYGDPVQRAADEFAAVAGRDDAEGFVDYLVLAQNVGGPSGAVFVLRFTRALPPGAGKDLQGATPEGEDTYRVGANGPGILKNSRVYFPPGGRLAVVATGSNQAQTEFVRGAAAGAADKSGSFAGAMDATARVVTRGNIWLLVRGTGGTKNWLAGSTKETLKDLKALGDKTEKGSPTFGVWTTPGGGGVRFGAAMELATPEDASALVEAMEAGPLGKGDESEPPNSMKSFQLFSDRRAASELLQSLRFKSKDECAYIIFTLTGDNAKRGMDLINSPSMGLGGGGGPGGFTMPGGGGPAQPGLPGGIATPGMGP